MARKNEDEEEGEGEHLHAAPPETAPAVTTWKKVGTQIDAATLRRLKRFVAEYDLEMREVITQALDEYFDKRDF